MADDRMRIITQNGIDELRRQLYVIDRARTDLPPGGDALLAIGATLKRAAAAIAQIVQALPVAQPLPAGVMRDLEEATAMSREAHSTEGTGSMAKKTAAKKTAKKKTAKRKVASKRELISPRGDARYIRRDAKGRIKESDDVGRSQKADRRTNAKKKVKSGQGDKGDR